MKTKIFIITVLTITFGITTLAAENIILSGDSNTEYGKYTITNADKKITVKDTELKTYYLDYEKGEQPIYIAIDKQKNCKNYIVRSTHFEIQYTCKKDKFGVTYMQAKYITIDPQLVDQRLDNTEFSKQKILTNSEKSEKELLGLIASYFPSLLKDRYKAALI